MIMVLSDGGKNTAVIEKHLKMHNEKYVFLFSDVIAASRFGKGNVIIGKPSKAEMKKVYAECKIDGVIDATEEPVSKLSQAALSACGDSIKYVKLVNCRDYDGAETVLSYREIADRITGYRRNTLIYASGAVTRTISGYTGGKEDKIFVVIRKSPVFDVSGALEYGVPLLNIKEYDAFAEGDEIRYAVERLSVGQVVFADDRVSEEKADTAMAMGVKVILTHSAGVEYPICVDNIRDALIEIHNAKR